MLCMSDRCPLGISFFWALLCLPVSLLQAAELCRLDPAESGVQAVQVEDIFDGDTVRLADGRKVRLVGINTPEVQHGAKPAEPWADQATEQLQLLLKKKPIYLLQGLDSHDHYGRVLGHLFTADGQSVIAELLASGAGFQVAIPPNLRYVDCFAQAQALARQQALGVWGHAYYQPLPATSAQLRNGYARVSGYVESVTMSKKAIWVELKGQVSLKVEKTAAPYIDEALLDELMTMSRALGAVDPIQLEAQGWLSDRLTWSGNAPELVRQGVRKRFQMKIPHQVAWRKRPNHPH